MCSCEFVRKNPVEERFSIISTSVASGRPNLFRVSVTTEAFVVCPDASRQIAVARCDAFRNQAPGWCLSAQSHPWKRPLDLLLIALSLPFWLPLLLLLAAWIKCVSPGPVVFRQERIGRGGARFMMFKFRSMKVDAASAPHVSHVTQLIQSDAPMTKLDRAGDDRLIPLGALIRAAGLDELPQVFNVIRGEMSLVGPRPCTPYEFEHYQPRQRARVALAPGLTGYWQVNGKNRTTFSEMIEMDLFYARNASLMLDLAVLARTGPALLQELRGSAGAARREQVKG